MTTTVKDVAEIVEAIRKVNRDIKDYYWMANQINAQEVTSYIQATQYSEEATLPKAPYETNDPTYRIVQRRIRIAERKQRLIDKVVRLEQAVATLEDERERMVIEACMDKLTLSEIGSVLGVTKQAVYETKEKAVRKLAVKMYLKKDYKK